MPNQKMESKREQKKFSCRDHLKKKKKEANKKKWVRQVYAKNKSLKCY